MAFVVEKRRKTDPCAKSRWKNYGYLTESPDLVEVLKKKQVKAVFGSERKDVGAVRSFAE